MEKAKKIISHFINVSSEEIIDTTKMDHTVIASSILQHRMYALLADKGYIVENPGLIETYLDFKEMINNQQMKSCEIHMTKENNKSIFDKNFSLEEKDSFSNGIGIDIEDIESFELLEDYNAHKFYTENFSKSEIDYCQNKAEPRSSFAALFSLKEAIIKADNTFKNRPFNTIVISHSDSGCPIFKGFLLSVTHNKSYVITMAFKKNIIVNENKYENPANKIVTNEYVTKQEVLIIGLFCIVISIVINMFLG